MPGRNSNSFIATSEPSIVRDNIMSRRTLGLNKRPERVPLLAGDVMAVTVDSSDPFKRLGIEDHLVAAPPTLPPILDQLTPTVRSLPLPVPQQPLQALDAGFEILWLAVGIG